MRVPVIPSSMAVAILAAGSAVVFISLLLGMPGAAATWLAASIVLALLAAAGWDYTASVRAWRRSAPTLARRLPQAFALGARRPVPLFIENHGSRAWECQLHDQPDGTLLFEGLPIRVTLPPGTRVEAGYSVRPSARGEVTFEAADVRVRSRWRLCELRERLGVREVRRVYPEFGQIADMGGWPGIGACRKSGSRPISSAAKEPTSNSSPSTAPAIPCATSTGRRHCGSQSRWSGSSRMNGISASCCSWTAGAGCAPTTGRAPLAAHTLTRS